MFEFTQSMYIAGIWFVREKEDVPLDQRQDWMAMVWKAGSPPQGPWHCRYRVCYHRQEGIYIKDGGTPDERSWYDATIDGTFSEDAILEKMEHLAAQIAAYNGVPVNSIHVQGDGPKAIQLLMAQPWCHFSTSEPLPAWTEEQRG